DLRARLARGAAIEHSLRGKAAHRVGPVAPPLRALAARLVELLRAVGQCIADVERDALARDDRPRAVIDLALRLVLREAERDQLTQHVARLRLPATDDPLH